MSGEFSFIDRLRARLPKRPEGQVGVGDDAAVLAHGQLVAADALVEGVHFDLAWCDATDVGWKALAVNVSDIAAMGGVPTACVVAATIPPGREPFADGVLDGLIEAADAFACPLVGGDTTSGPSAVISVTVIGHAEQPVTRARARPGDAIFVTGSLGGPAAALRALNAGREPDATGAARLRRPEPRAAAGLAAVAAGATAMIDVSDGFGRDLQHVLAESGVGAWVEANSLPIGDGATLDDALGGGDDYELVFTAPSIAAVRDAFRAAGLAPPAGVGMITAEPQRWLRTRAGAVPLADSGWEHQLGD